MKKKNKFNYIRNREGYALVTVLVILVVLSILFISVYTLLQSNTKQIIVQEQNLKAHYLARSGAMLAYTAIVDDSSPKLIEDFNGGNYASASNGLKEKIEFEEDGAIANVVAWHKGNYIIIESVAELESNKIKSTIYLKFEKTDPKMITWSKNLD